MDASFLSKLAKELLSNNSSLLHHTNIVLPNKRAKIFLIEELKRQSSTTFLAPKIISIEMLIEEISQLRTLDNIELLFEFYIVYLENTEKVIHIDGDDLRLIFENKDFSETGRRKNIERAQDIARFMSEKGYDVVVSLVSPYRDQREQFKENNEVHEIYVHTTDDRGRNDFHVTNYEAPTDDFVEIDTTDRLEVDSFIELTIKLNI